MTPIIIINLERMLAILQPLTFHSSDISELAVSPSSSTKLMIRNLSLDRPPNWKPGNSVTVTVSLAPAFKHPVLGLTLNFSGEVVFTLF